MWFPSLFGGSQGSAKVITGAEARQLVTAGAQLVDVRSRAEFGSGHLPGAKNIPVDELGARSGELDQSRQVVVYCRSGGRSRAAGATLIGQGFGQVFDLGPLTAW